MTRRTRTKNCRTRTFLYTSFLLHFYKSSIWTKRDNNLKRNITRNKKCIAMNAFCTWHISIRSKLFLKSMSGLIDHRKFKFIRKSSHRMIWWVAKELTREADVFKGENSIIKLTWQYKLYVLLSRYKQFTERQTPPFFSDWEQLIISQLLKLSCIFKHFLGKIIIFNNYWC